MNEIKLFTNKEFGEIRTMNIDEEPWFVGKDVAEALGYSNASKAVSTHVGEEDRILKVLEADSQNGNVVKTQTALINESGLYALIFGSKLESAKRFKHWVTSEVLPAIRKTGSYQKPMSPVEMMRIQLGMIDDHEGRITDLEQNMTIDYEQQMSLGDIVNRVVVDSLGGKDSNAYHEIGRKVFAECNRDLKHYFNINARNNVPKKKFDEAVDYVKNWQPCTNTRIMIQDCNAQLSM
jgi:prophage antirepressor-like protein